MVLILAFPHQTTSRSFDVIILIPIFPIRQHPDHLVSRSTKRDFSNCHRWATLWSSFSSWSPSPLSCSSPPPLFSSSSPSASTLSSSCPLTHAWVWPRNRKARQWRRRKAVLKSHWSCLCIMWCLKVAVSNIEKSHWEHFQKYIGRHGGGGEGGKLF